MQIEKIVTGALFLVISSNMAFGLERVTPKLIAHKEWTTGGAQGWMRRQEGSSVYHHELSSANATAYVGAAQGNSRSNTYVYGRHDYIISNTRDDPKIFQFQYKLCADNSQCFNFIDYVEIKGKSFASGTGTTTVAAYFDKPGVYQSMAYTGIIGDVNVHDTSHSTIDIRKL